LADQKKTAGVLYRKHSIKKKKKRMNLACVEGKKKSNSEILNEKWNTRRPVTFWK
jgi:hypothetical protein